jgi:hypothetical protein
MFWRSIALASAVLFLGSEALGQTPAAAPSEPAETPTYRAPRTLFGSPSLEGVWNHNFIILVEANGPAPLVVPEAAASAIAQKIAEGLSKGFDAQLDPEVPGMILNTDGLPLVRGERRTRTLVQPEDGKFPYTPEARLQAGRYDDRNLEGPETCPNWERCVTSLGLPPITGVVVTNGNPRQIVQTPEHVVIHTEYGGEARIIPFTDKHGALGLKPLLGDSIARWDGEALVIETLGLPEKDRVRFFSGLMVPATAKVIERYERLSENELLYQYTVEDASIYTAPWRAEYSVYRTDQRMFEHACHEGNYSLPNILRSARVQEQGR